MEVPDFETQVSLLFRVLKSAIKNNDVELQQTTIMGKEAVLICLKNPENPEEVAPNSVIITSEIFELLNTDKDGNQIE